LSELLPSRRLHSKPLDTVNEEDGDLSIVTGRQGIRVLFRLLFAEHGRRSRLSNSRRRLTEAGRNKSYITLAMEPTGCIPLLASSSTRRAISTAPLVRAVPRLVEVVKRRGRYLRSSHRHRPGTPCGSTRVYFRLDDQVPETHLLRLIDKHISFAFVRETLKQSYSETGRPSVDPELLLRIPVVCFTPPLSRNCRDCSTPPFSVVVTMGGNAITAVISHWKPPTPSGQRAL
jgi:hypothetical protein